MSNLYNYKLNSPYKGLMPYTEMDRLIFFGRDTDQEIILNNLITWRLTVLYGASGVGKSSLLRAGVAHYLHQSAQDNVNLVGKPGWAVIVFPYFPAEKKSNQDLEEESDRKFSWQNPLTGIKEQLKAEMKSLGVKELPPENISLVETLKEWVKIIGTEKESGRLFIILDQFEEYFASLSEFASSSQRDKQELLKNFDKEFSDAVNDINLNVNFLISIREESLSKIDHFERQIKSDLLKKRLELKPLDRESARKAIEKPITEYNRQSIILDSLQNSRLTIVYGDSDAYRNTIFQDGIAHYLRQSKYLNNWSKNDKSLRQLIGQLPEKRKEKLFIILDQFEDYFFIYPEKAKELLQELLSIIQEVPNINFLISISNQWLSEFELFNNQITDCPKYLYLFKDDRKIDSIAERIVNSNNAKPLIKLIKLIKFSIEPKLIDDVLDGIESEPKCFEASYLQLVMAHLWQEKTKINVPLKFWLILLEMDSLAGILFLRKSLKHPSYTLQAKTYRKFASQNLESDNWAKLAAKNIVREHLYKYLKSQELSEWVEMAACLFYYLITPGGSRLAQTVKDLIDYANDSRPIGERELTEAEIRLLLKKLSRKNFPILRPVLGDHYEIFRPILDEAILHLVQLHRQIKHLKQEAKDSLQEFESSQLQSLVKIMEIGEKLGEIRETDRLLFAQLGGVPPIINLALQKILDEIREKNRFELKYESKPIPISAYGISFSFDDKKLAISSIDGSIYLLDLQEDKRPKRIFSDPLTSFCCISFSFDGKQLVTASWDGTVQLWDLEGKELFPPPLKFGHPVYFVCFRPEKQQVVIASEKGAYLWDLESDKQPKILNHEGEGSVYFASFSLDGQKLATVSWSSSGSKVYLRNPDSCSEKPIISFSPPVGTIVYRANFSPDGQNLVTVSWDGTAHLWDIQDIDKNLDSTDPSEPKLLSSFKHQGPVYYGNFNRVGDQVVTASWDGTIRHWNRQGEELAKFIVNRSPAYRASLSYDDRQLITVTWDSVAHVWDLDKKLEIISLKHDMDLQLNTVPIIWLLLRGIIPLAGILSLRKSPTAVYRLSFNSDGKQLASASRDNKIRLWDWDLQKPNEKPRTFPVDKAPVYYACFSPDGKILASASEDGKVRLWDLEKSDQTPKVLDDHHERVHSVCFSPDGKLLASASGDCKVCLWDWKQQTKQQEFEEHKGTVFYACFSPDGKKLASASMDGFARLWDWETEGKKSVEFKGHVGPVYCVTFNPKEPKLATASGDGTVRLWDLEGNKLGQCIGQCIGHEGPVFWVDFSPNGEQLVTASWDGTVRLWNLQGQSIAVFRDHEDKKPIYCARFSPDGKWLATASEDGTVKIRPLEDLDRMLHRARHWRKDTSVE